jgi:hypothetical protein
VNGNDLRSYWSAKGYTQMTVWSRHDHEIFSQHGYTTCLEWLEAERDRINKSPLHRARVVADGKNGRSALFVSMAT